MSKFSEGVDSVTGARRHAARISDVLGSRSTALVPINRPASVREYLRGLSEGAPPDVTTDGVGTLAGATAGAILWKEHRVLGGIGGASLGRNLPALFRPGERDMALCNLGQTGAGVLGARLMLGSPVTGFIVAWFAAGLVVHFGGFRR